MPTAGEPPSTSWSSRASLTFSPAGEPRIVGDKRPGPTPSLNETQVFTLFLILTLHRRPPLFTEMAAMLYHADQSLLDLLGVVKPDASETALFHRAYNTYHERLVPLLNPEPESLYRLMLKGDYAALVAERDVEDCPPEALGALDHVHRRTDLGLLDAPAARAPSQDHGGRGDRRDPHGVTGAWPRSPERICLVRPDLWLVQAGRRPRRQPGCSGHQPSQDPIQAHRRRTGLQPGVSPCSRSAYPAFPASWSGRSWTNRARGSPRTP